MGGVLPPFLGTEPGRIASQSPFRASPEELVFRFGTSPWRNQLLRGLLDFRAAWRNEGIIAGFQWIDGSFVEDKELVKGQPPSDVDVITVFERPVAASTGTAWFRLANKLSSTLLDPDFCKTSFRCDAYPIDLGADGKTVAELSAFWFSLFSHQRDTFRWKGVVQIPLGDASMDKAANAELIRRGA